ncbi:MAG TPA: nuclear transport factor 2 family protein, partial [Pyrinomonadaceae bacterium]|nr:nuclear transport factor 2 family protein [Pyrinomonadaceae bacterium]
MSESNKAIIENIYNAFNSREYATVLTFFSSDFEWYAADSSPLSDLSPYHGVEAVRTGVFDRITGGFAKLEVVPDEVFAGDEGRVAILGYYHGRFAVKQKNFAHRLLTFGPSATAKQSSFNSIS